MYMNFFSSNFTQTDEINYIYFHYPPPYYLIIK
jgi:hypothetical protein